MTVSNLRAPTEEGHSNLGPGPLREHDLTPSRGFDPMHMDVIGGSLVHGHKEVVVRLR